jgi:hypothetical protein
MSHLLPARNLMPLYPSDPVTVVLDLGIMIMISSRPPKHAFPFQSSGFPSHHPHIHTGLGRVVPPIPSPTLVFHSSVRRISHTYPPIPPRLSSLARPILPPLPYPPPSSGNCNHPISSHLYTPHLQRSLQVTNTTLWQWTGLPTNPHFGHLDIDIQ